MSPTLVPGMLLSLLSLCVSLCVSLSPTTLGEASLGEMFREVGDLMEDTQLRLQEAAQEMESEEEGFSRELEAIDVDKLPPNYHNQSDTETRAGNNTVHTHQEIHKTTDEETGNVIVSEKIITSVNGEDRAHECIVDEDCGEEQFCLVSLLESKCLKRRSQGQECVRDAECVSGQLCVWGHCRTNAHKGQNGTICEQQRDCDTHTCCALQTDLLFPVCSPLPTEDQLCHRPSQSLLDLITWEFDPEGALDHCPCAKGLSCQPHRPGSLSVCKQSRAVDESPFTPGYLRIEDLTFPDEVSREDKDSHRALVQAVERREEDELYHEISDESDRDRSLLSGI